MLFGFLHVNIMELMIISVMFLCAYYIFKYIIHIEQDEKEASSALCFLRSVPKIACGVGRKSAVTSYGYSTYNSTTTTFKNLLFGKNYFSLMFRR